MIRLKYDGYRFQVKTFGIAFLTGSLLVTGCSMNPHLTRKESEQQKSLVATREKEKAESEIKAATEEDTISTVSHDVSATDADRSETVKLVDASEQLYPTPLEPVQAPAAGDQPVLSGGMTLQDLESIALENNPAIQELAASTQKAAGYREQVTTRPNPTVGYQGQQLADRGTDQHLAFIEREFVTANKLELNHRVLNATLSAQLQELEAQRFRVRTDIRIRFYETLALQKQLELIKEFSQVAEKGVDFAKQRMDAGEGTRVDVLQSKILLNEVQLTQRQTRAKLSAVWREIAAISGIPELEYTKLQGTLPSETGIVDWEGLASNIVTASPEYAAAHDRISRAFAALERQEVQPIPNMSAQLGAGVDYGTNSGMLNLQVGVPLPISNRNQGNISAAHAEICRAQMEALRIKNAIEERLAVVSREYDTATAAIDLYSTNILPSASESLDLANQAYKAGEVGFVQILIARKTFFDTNLKYVDAQAQLAGAQAKIDGYMLTGALNDVRDDSGDSSLRDQTFSQQ
ncbi:MAG: TolC family protein [Planctomycetaceae bacterium]|nr:TolC family protein [Planctomycetaceae bacterium]